MVNFKQKLLNLIAQQGWDREQFYEHMNVSRSTGSKWFMKKATKPGLKTVMKMAKLFNVDVNWLYYDDQPWPPPGRAPIESLATLPLKSLLEMMAEAFRIAAGAIDESAAPASSSGRKIPHQK